MRGPRLHHYVPRFYLKGFADPSILKRENKEAIWIYEKGKEPRRSAPEKEARERDFYSWVAGDTRNLDVEHWFGNLENQIAPIITSLSEAPREVASSEKELLALFIGTMQQRTPAARWLAENRMDPLISKLMKETAADPVTFRSFVEENRPFPEEGEAFDLEEIRQDILAGRGDVIAENPEHKLLSIIEVGKMVAKVLLEMNWQTIYSEDQDHFLTSDDPVISFVVDASEKLQLRAGVGTPGVDVWFPLSHTICLRMNKDCEAGLGRWLSAGIRMINKLLIICAHRFVYACERSDHLKRLMNKKGSQVSVKVADLRFEGQSF